MANTSLRREVSVTGNRKIFTLSAWVKRTQLGSSSLGNIFSQYVGSGSANIATHFRVRFQSNDAIGVAAGGTDLLITNAVYRDTNAWYHVVCAVDTTQSTADDRIKLYVNGEQITSFASRNNPSQNVDTVVNLAGSSHYPRIGADDSDGAGPYNFFDGLMSHVHFIDGTAYPASTFGSTDSVTGQWQLTTDPSITMGTNGFTILKDGNTITDQSTNSNDFISLGTGVTKTVDNPSDNFATVNTLYYSAENVNATGIHFGNLGVNQQGTAAPFYSTIAVPSGKYYWEGFVETVGSNNMHGVHRTEDISQATNAGNPANGAYGYAYRSDGSKFNNGSATSYGNSFTSGDYISVAYDATNGAIWFAKNGTWQNSATTSEIAAGTTTNAAFSSMPTNGVFYTPYTYLTNSGVVRFNFGNGVFGATALGTTYSPTAGNTGAKFKYNIIPNGFTAISTKGLNA